MRNPFVDLAFQKFSISEFHIADPTASMQVASRLDPEILIQIWVFPLSTGPAVRAAVLSVLAYRRLESSRHRAIGGGSSPETNEGL